MRRTPSAEPMLRLSAAVAVVLMCAPFALRSKASDHWASLRSRGDHAAAVVREQLEAEVHASPAEARR
jgi:hypothetical protein